MAIETPLWMDPNPTTSAAPEFSARADRGIIAALFTEGVADVQAGDLAVTQRSAGANMTVTVAAGAVYVAGDDTIRQGTYRVVVTAAESVTIPGAPSSGSRIDLVVLRVYDGSANGGTRHGAAIEVVTGAAGSSPSAPSLPPTAIPLARVAVTSGQSAVTGSNITDLRTQSAANVLKVGVQAEPLTTTQIDSITGAAAFPGRVVTNTDTDTLEVFGSDGVARSQSMGIFGDASDGNVTISGSISLTRHMYYRNLTIPSGAQIDPNGFRIHVADLLSLGGAIRSAPTTTGGGIDVPPVAPGSGVQGGTGGAGGRGGAPSAYSYLAENGGNAVPATPLALLRAFVSALVGGASAGAPGNKGGRGAFSSGDGGQGYNSAELQPTAGGRGANGIVIMAARIEGAGTIESVGSAGAAGAAAITGATAAGGNGGGGGGGGGGVLILTYRGRRGGSTVRSFGGAAGPAGSGYGSQVAAVSGTAGAAGQILELTLMGA